MKNSFYTFILEVKLILEKGADIDLKDPYGRTALRLAIENRVEAGVIEILKIADEGASGSDNSSSQPSQQAPQQVSPQPTPQGGQ